MSVSAVSAPAPAPPAAAAGAERLPALLRTPAALAIVFAITLVFRLVALPGSTPRNMDADSTHFLNIVRCFERGQGFSNVGAWPAWMQPEKLPMPETFKEPGYPWLIWKLKPLTGGDPFRAGQLISFVAGLAIPLLLYALARRLTADRTVAFGAGLLAAASPLLIEQSVRVMVDSSFPAVALLALVLAERRTDVTNGARATALDLAVGAALGAAFLLRSGAMLLWLPLALLSFRGRRPLAAVAGLVLTALAAALVASPFILRNLRLFHTWFHSDVSEYAIWPYVDTLQFNAGLEHPPAPIPFLLSHPVPVAKHWLVSAVRFALHTFPGEILGHQWIVPAIAGLAVSLRRWRRYLFVYAVMAFMHGLILALHWDARYFVIPAILWCLLAASGAIAILRRLGPSPGTAGLDLRPIAGGLLVVALLVQAQVARQQVRRFDYVENPAAIALGPELHRRLAPGESVMVMTTSAYAWWADRPAVHLVISDRERFLATVRRLRVKLAVLPTARLAEFASRYEGGRLPEAFQFERSDPALGVTLFRVDPDAAPRSAAR